MEPWGSCPMEPLLSCRGRSWEILCRSLCFPRRLVVTAQVSDSCNVTDWLQHPLPHGAGFMKWEGSRIVQENGYIRKARRWNGTSLCLGWVNVLWAHCIFLGYDKVLALVEEKIKKPNIAGRWRGIFRWKKPSPTPPQICSSVWGWKYQRKAFPIPRKRLESETLAFFSSALLSTNVSGLK